LEGLIACFHGSGVLLLLRFRGFDKGVFVGVGEFVGLLALENSLVNVLPLMQRLKQPADKVCGK
jgi:hypothetical protein